MLHSNRMSQWYFHARRKDIGSYVDVIVDDLHDDEELLEYDTKTKQNTQYNSDERKPSEEYHKIRELLY